LAKPNVFVGNGGRLPRPAGNHRWRLDASFAFIAVFLNTILMRSSHHSFSTKEKARNKVVFMEKITPHGAVEEQC
jgi:hypothetical protein